MFSEFEDVRKWLNDRQITFVQLKSGPSHAAVCERAIRTIKQRLWRHFTLTGKKRWVDILQTIIHDINNSYHRILKRTPASINTTNEDLVYRELYGSVKQEAPVYKVGDQVRIKDAKSLFRKGYERTFSTDIYKIASIVKKSPVAYRLTLDGDQVRGIFYNEQLVNAGTEDGYRRNIRRPI